MKKKKISIPETMLPEQPCNHSGEKFFTCPQGHITTEFFSCHVESYCGALQSLLECPFSYNTWLPTPLKKPIQLNFKPVRTFQCVLMTTTIPYSFVCDFTADCQDESDETFCLHDGACSGFLCENGECTASENVCDTFTHCVDGSDKKKCTKIQYRWIYPPQSSTLSPVIIHFDGKGNFARKPMNASESCPDTHFRCRGKEDDCLPVFVLCNGVYDCLGHEDEAECDGIRTCPGYYRCWDSNICVHPDHMCDGWPQCPRQDDELLCNVTCPKECRCQGLAFVCHQPFPAQHFPVLRYLDASGSSIKPDQLRDNYYLILIKLQACKLNFLTHIVFRNLVTLNLDEH